MPAEPAGDVADDGKANPDAFLRQPAEFVAL
jgi:hypothetical protein